MAMNVTPFQSTDEFTMAGFNGKINDINSGVDNEIASALSGFARIETGSYVGTGMYGAANPNTLTFGFAPQLVILPHVDDYNGCPEHVMFYAGTRNYKIANGITGTLEGRELSWYSTRSASEQFNVSGRTYHYIAIG